jgi:hypothetical protein
LGDCADNDYGPGDYPAGFYPEGATAEYDDELGFGERDAMVWAGAPPPIRDLRTAPRRPRRRRAPIFHAEIETIVHDSKFPQHINVARDVAYQKCSPGCRVSNDHLSELLKHGKQIIIKGWDYVNNPETSSRSPCSGAVTELERAKIIERTRADGSTGSRRRVRRHLSREQPRCGRWHCCGPSIGCR